MIIKELYLKNFGKFSDRHFLIEDGIHIFYGENEYGKSTIYTFIKAMFFGMERGRGKAALHDEFTRYEPWENPNYYAGVMFFESGGKCFRLERTFDRYTRSASLICEDDGEELSIEDGDLEMLLGGMTAEAFENTIAIGQLSAKPGNALAEELKNYAANYYETGSGTVDLSGTLELLRQRRRSVQQEIKELSEKQEKKSALVRQECQYISKDAEKLRRELEDNQEKINSLGQTRQELESEVENKDTEDVERAIQNKLDSTESSTGRSLISVGILGVIAGVAGRIWSAFMGNGGLLGSGAISVMSWIFLVLGLILACAGIVKLFQQKPLPDNVDEELETPKGQPLQHESERYLQKLEWENQRIKAEWKEKQVRFQNLQEQLAELEIPDHQLRSLRTTDAALKLAEEKLLKAARSMVLGFGDVLNQKASEVLGEITDGRYTKLLIDEHLAMTLFEEGRRIPVERVSCGTIEQVYFSLRMAVIELLYEEPLPVIFDEAFAFYDEKRLKSTLKWLSEQQRQVIIFTCQKRELEISEQLYPFRLKGRFT